MTCSKFKNSRLGESMELDAFVEVLDNHSVEYTVTGALADSYMIVYSEKCSSNPFCYLVYGKCLIDNPPMSISWANKRVYLCGFEEIKDVTWVIEASKFNLSEENLFLLGDEVAEGLRGVLGE